MPLNSYSSLSSAKKDLNRRGFDGQFRYEDSQLINTKTQRAFSSQDLIIVEYHRFEGIPNPSGMTIVFAIDSKVGEKGTLIMSYDTQADMNIISFIDKVPISSAQN